MCGSPRPFVHNPSSYPGYLISIGEKADQIAQAFESRQQTTEQTLAALRRLTEQVAEARKERDATKLSPESFAVY